jgi:hypothetical protein
MDSELQELAHLGYSRDPIYFGEHILGIRFNFAQKRLIRMVAPRDGSETWATKFLVFWAANQVGKTLGLAFLLLWAAWNKIGVPTAETSRWLDAPYEWYHLSPFQEQAYLPLRDIELLVQGSHPAQFDKATGEYRPMRIPEGMVKSVTLEHYYDGLELWNGAHIHFRTTSERAKALQGRRAAGISFDEAAFETHLIEIIEEVLSMRLIASGGPLFIVSTPDGINDFFELVTRLRDSGHHILGEAGEIDDRVWVNDDGEVLMYADVYDNLGFGLTQEAIDREEAKQSAHKEQTLRGAFLNPQEAFFVPLERIEAAFDVTLPVHVPPQDGHSYSAFWDPSLDSDPTAGIVIDVTDPDHWQGVYLQWNQIPLGVDDLLMEIHRTHFWYHAKPSMARRMIRGTTCKSGWDSTSMGGHMFTQLLSDISPKQPIDFAGKKQIKLDALTNLRMLLLTGKLKFPKTGPWLRLLREVMNYRLVDDKIQQDTVIAAAGAAQNGHGMGAGGQVRAAFRPGATVAQRGRI